MGLGLQDLGVGDRARLEAFTAGGAYRRRLIAMGLTPGTEFTVVRVAPLGDPVEITVRGFSLSLRKDEARGLKISRLGA